MEGGGRGGPPLVRTLAKPEHQRMVDDIRFEAFDHCFWFFFVKCADGDDDDKADSLCK